MSKSQEWHWCCNVSVPGKSGAYDQVLDSLLLQMETLGWSERERFDVQLAFEEAITNAIKHGNCSDPLKKVHVCCDVLKEHVSITIGDEGMGFNPDIVPDPRHPDNLLIPTGRGIFLIRHIMHDVNFSANGNSITMIKHRGYRNS